MTEAVATKPMPVVLQSQNMWPSVQGPSLSSGAATWLGPKAAQTPLGVTAGLSAEEVMPAACLSAVPIFVGDPAATTQAPQGPSLQQRPSPPPATPLREAQQAPPEPPQPPPAGPWDPVGPSPQQRSSPPPATFLGAVPPLPPYPPPESDEESDGEPNPWANFT